MRRRDFIVIFGFAAIVQPAIVQAQGSVKRPLVGVLMPVSQAAASVWSDRLQRGLRELGYVEGRDVDIVYRYSDGDHARLPALAEDLVRLGPRVVVTGSMLSTFAVKQATETIPIICATLTDPIGFGLATTDARPGGQVTGILFTLDTLPGKQIEMALEAVSGVATLGMLVNTKNLAAQIPRRDAMAAAATLGIKPVLVDVRDADGLDAAFQVLAHAGVGLVFVLPDPLFVSERRRIAALAIEAHLPTLFALREHVQEGGLLSYGIDVSEGFRRVASFVDKILKGAKPGDLPIELPTKFELVINLKTAKALGITVPATLLARADEVIE
jgi:putative tryptophan/tyrosine transport system substrate-binding protein